MPPFSWPRGTVSIPPHFGGPGSGERDYVLIKPWIKPQLSSNSDITKPRVAAWFRKSGRESLHGGNQLHLGSACVSVSDVASGSDRTVGPRESTPTLQQQGPCQMILESVESVKVETGRADC